MFQVEINVLPLSVESQPGEFAAGDNKKSPAVIQRFVTENGNIQVILPVENIDSVIQTMLNAKEAIEAAGPSAGMSASGIIIPKSEREVEELAKAQQQIIQGEGNER
jgi:hypothetical protein